LKEIDGVLQLQRSWKAKSFVKGLEIMKRVADVAEAEGMFTSSMPSLGYLSSHY
jgi:hypothetical protein